MRGISIVCGGQYGSEGKGKVSEFWAKKMNAKAVVRVGGPNAGHTNLTGELALRMIPAGVTYDAANVTAVLPAGSYINKSVLLEEMYEVYGSVDEANVLISPNAVIINPDDKLRESHDNLRDTIGSTLSGTGSALIRRIERSGFCKFAKDVPELKPFIGDTQMYLNDLLSRGEKIVIEGTQGYGLSLLHANCWPYTTARDTTAAGFLSETGLSPLDVEHVVMVIRSYPIRVGGNSGPMPNEVTWDDVSVESDSGKYFEECTTVTKRPRRVARFDSDVVVRAINANDPDVIVMNHVDYVDMNMSGTRKLSPKQIGFISQIQTAIGRNIDYVGNGRDILLPLDNRSENTVIG